jgi:hypothetical protein
MRKAVEFDGISGNDGSYTKQHSCSKYTEQWHVISSGFVF